MKMGPRHTRCPPGYIAAPTERKYAARYHHRLPCFSNCHQDIYDVAMAHGEYRERHGGVSGERCWNRIGRSIVARRGHHGTLRWHWVARPPTPRRAETLTSAASFFSTPSPRLLIS